MKRCLFSGAAVFLSMLVLPATAQREPVLNVDIPKEVFTRGGQKTVSCQRCCIYANSSYSEGAIINVEGNLLQCQRAPGTTGTNPLIWQRITP